MDAMLRAAQAYVGTPYLEGEFDCADLAAKVQWELFSRVIQLPTHRRRPARPRDQEREIHRLCGEIALPIAVPETGCGVLMFEPARDPIWHVGVAFCVPGETWILHNSLTAGHAVLQRWSDMRRWGMQLDGFYQWK